MVLGLERCLEVLKQNEQLRRRFGATVRIGAFDWKREDDRKAYRSFLRTVQERVTEYAMPDLRDLGMAFRMHYASYGLVGYTMKIIRGAVRIAASRGHRNISLDIISESFSQNIWIDQLGHSNPFTDHFNPDTARPIKSPQADPPILLVRANKHLIELHA